MPRARECKFEQIKTIDCVLIRTELAGNRRHIWRVPIWRKNATCMVMRSSMTQGPDCPRLWQDTKVNQIRSVLPLLLKCFWGCFYMMHELLKCCTKLPKNKRVHATVQTNEHMSQASQKVLGGLWRWVRLRWPAQGSQIRHWPMTASAKEKSDSKILYL